MLSFAEEIYLLALDNTTGKIVIPSKDIVLNNVLIGAVLAELAFLDKIDNDREKIYILNTDHTGNPLLDEIIETLAAGKVKEMTIYQALKMLIPKAKDIENDVLEHLIGKGILKQVDEKILWIFPSKRYPIINNVEVKDVEARLREIVLSETIPSPRDAVLISLVNTCDLFSEILSPRELRRCSQRIEELAKMDLVEQEVADMINQINAFRTMPPYI